MIYLVKTVDGGQHRIPANEVSVDYLTGFPTNSVWVVAEDGTFVAVKYIVSIRPLKGSL